MRLLKLTVRGATVIKDTVSIDFDRFGPGLIAIVGKNGSGKSTLMEATPVALWKTFPSRPQFYENFNGRDAFIEAEFSGGVTVRLAVDAVKRTTEGYVMLLGVPVNDGKAAGFEAAITLHFGSVALFLASAFACQTREGSFIGMAKGDRKDIFAELLCIGSIQALAQNAAEQRATAEASLMVVRTEEHRLYGEIETLKGADANVTMAEAAATGAADFLTAKREWEAESRTILERAKALSEQQESIQAAERDARLALVRASKAVEQAEARVPAVERVRDARLRALAARKVDEIEPNARHDHLQEIQRIALDRSHLEARIKAMPDLEHAEAERDIATNGLAIVVENQKQAAAALAAFKDAERNLSVASREHATSVELKDRETKRLEKQVERLTQVPCTKAAEWIDPSTWDSLERDYMGPQSPLSATCLLLADAVAAQGQLNKVRATAIPTDELRQAEAALATAAEARDRWDGVDLDVSAWSVSLQNANEQVAKAKNVGVLHDSLKDLDAAQQRADAALEQKLAAAKKASVEAMDERRTIDADFDAEMLSAHVAITEARQVLVYARGVHEAAQEAASAAEAVDVTGAERILALAVKDREAAEFQLRESDRALARAAETAARLATIKAKLQEQAAIVTVAAQEANDWAMLEKALGREGVQALEIDAAGPEVAGLTNELLAACYGTRFSLTLETLAQKRDGGMKEVFDIRVFDGGSERAVEALSGGEKVVIGEALGLALAIFNARKNNVRWETLWRDETAGALDPVNAQAYVEMLRKAREVGGFHQIIFVAHQPEVWESADAVIKIADGRVAA